MYIPYYGNGKKRVKLPFEINLFSGGVFSSHCEMRLPDWTRGSRTRHSGLGCRPSVSAVRLSVSGRAGLSCGAASPDPPSESLVLDQQNKNIIKNHCRLYQFLKISMQKKNRITSSIISLAHLLFYIREIIIDYSIAKVVLSSISARPSCILQRVMCLYRPLGLRPPIRRAGVI